MRCSKLWTFEHGVHGMRLFKIVIAFLCDTVNIYWRHRNVMWMLVRGWACQRSPSSKTLTFSASEIICENHFVGSTCGSVFCSCRPWLFPTTSWDDYAISHFAYVVLKMLELMLLALMPLMRTCHLAVIMLQLCVNERIRSYSALKCRVR